MDTVGRECDGGQRGSPGTTTPAHARKDALPLTVECDHCTSCHDPKSVW